MVFLAEQGAAGLCARGLPAPPGWTDAPLGWMDAPLVPLRALHLLLKQVPRQWPVLEVNGHSLSLKPMATSGVSGE